MKKVFFTVSCTTVFILICFILFILVIASLCMISVPLAWADSRSCVSNNPQILLLKNYVPNKTLDSMNPDFYTYFGFRDWWRAPLVYPYSIHAVDGLDSGYLVDESAITDYETDSLQDGIQLFSGIQSFTFDKNYLLVDSSSGFILFEFKTGTSSSFETKQELIDKAVKLQFEGKFEFMSLREYNALFLCEK